MSHWFIRIILEIIMKYAYIYIKYVGLKIISILMGCDFQRDAVSIFAQLEDCWGTQDPELSKVYALNRELIHFNSAHSNLYFLPPQCVASPLLSLCYPSCSASELLIPIIMTSSGTWRRCRQSPSCLVKDFATSCETIKSGDRACRRLSPC